MSKTLYRLSIAALATACLFTSPVAARAQSINLTANDATFVGFGKGAVDTFGQVFTVNAGFTSLQNFTFFLSNDPLSTVNPGSLKFNAYVMRWDAVNQHVTGSVLFASSTQSGPTTLSQTYNFLTAGVSLAPAGSYVAFLSAAGLQQNIAATTAYASAEASATGTYSGGQLVFTNSGNDFSALSTTGWLFGGGATEDQAHFVANLSGPTTTVPEPSSLVLLVFGCATLAVLAMKRKRV